MMIRAFCHSGHRRLGDTDRLVLGDRLHPRATVRGLQSSKLIMLPFEARPTLQRTRKVRSNFASLGSLRKPGPRIGLSSLSEPPPPFQSRHGVQPIG